MSKEFLRTLGIGFGLFALAAAGSIEAQETNTIGNPQLKDFDLPGTRTTPPANTQQPAPTPAPTTTLPPVVTPPVAAPPATTTAPPTRTPATPSPAAREPAAREAPPAARTAPTQRETAPAAEAPTDLPVGVPAPTELEQALPAPPPADAPATQSEPPLTPAEPAQNMPWLYIALGALLALAALTALILFKRSRGSAADRADAVADYVAPKPEAPQEPDPLFAKRAAAKTAPAAAAPPPRPIAPPIPQAPPPPPQAVPAARDTGIVGISMRPKLELEFKADRAAATLTDTSVQFQLTIRNVGNRAARNVRIQVNMMNAGPDHDKELDAFFANAVSLEEPPVFAALEPGAVVHINSGITMPKTQLREISIQGRRLFIPMVAFNVFYEWEGGRSGQTSMSYLVGRQPPSPAEKMGAFRLDLGPRLYRSVGQRQGNLAKVV